MRLKANPRMRVGTREYTVRLYSKKGAPVSTFKKAAKFSISLGKRTLQRADTIPKGLSSTEKEIYILMVIEGLRRVPRPTIRTVRSFTEKILRTKSRKFKLLFYDSNGGYVQKIEDADRFSISYRDFSLVLRHTFSSTKLENRVKQIRQVFSKVRRWSFETVNNFFLVHKSKRQFIARDYTPWRAYSWTSVLDRDLVLSSENKEEVFDLIRKDFFSFLKVIFAKQKKYDRANWVVRFGWTFESTDGLPLDSEKDKKSTEEHFSGGWSKSAFFSNDIEDFILNLDELLEEIVESTDKYFNRKEKLVLNITNLRADYRYMEKGKK